MTNFKGGNIMRTLYRIHTEDVNRNQIENIVSKYFEGYTVISATGFWKLEREQTLIIEIIGESIKCYSKIEAIAREIKEVNSQESVLVFTIAGTGFLI